MANPPPPQPPTNPQELDVTIISAKHLKNITWRSGADLRPYAVVSLDPLHRHSTIPDHSTKPVWNHRFSLPLSSSLSDSFLTIEIVHSNPSETLNPLVGAAKVPLSELVESSGGDGRLLRTIQLLRPSGRPQGKVRVRVAVRERPPPPPSPSPIPSYQSYGFGPQSGFYYSSAPPPPPPPRDYREYTSSPYAAAAPPPPPYGYGGGYADSYASGYYSGGYYSQPPHPPQLSGRVSGSGPSAPVVSAGYDRISGGGVGGVAGAFSGLGLEERGKREDEKKEERGGSVVLSSVKDEYGDYYRGKY